MSELRERDVYRFRYSPKKEWGFDSRTWCFEGYLVVVGGQLVDTYWGIGNSSGRVLYPGTIEAEVAAGGSFDFYFNLDDVEAIGNSEANYYADADLFYISEQHACSDRCLQTFKRRGAVRDFEKMLSVLREKSRQEASHIEIATRRHAELERDIERVLNGDLSVHIS